VAGCCASFVNGWRTAVNEPLYNYMS